MYYRLVTGAIPEPQAGSPTMAGMPERPAPYGPSADPRPLEAALDRVGDRWSLLIVETLLDGARRFGELSEALPGIAPNILTDRLRRLEREGIVRATPYQQRPVRMAYALTADARDLASALRLLADWGARRVGGAEPIRHELCGTPLEAHWFCRTCSVVVEDAQATETRVV